jgi:hypothetical protein
MLCLNIRSTYPRIGLHTQQAWVEEASVKPAELSTNYEAPRADIWPAGVVVDIDSYPSRHSYGAETMTDFTRDHGQQGISDVQEGTSGHTQNAWDMIENAATKHGGNRIAAQAKSKLAEQISQQRMLVAESIPAPVITVTPSTMQGNIDTGKDEVSIQTYAEANIVAHPGTVQTYLAQQGSIRMWTTEGQYDIYA